MFFLDSWIADKTHMPNSLRNNAKQARQWIAAWQTTRLQEILVHAKKYSLHYGHRLQDVDLSDIDIDNIEKVPFSKQSELLLDPLSFLTISDKTVDKTAAMLSSPISGSAKQIPSSVTDLDATIDFFHHIFAGILQPKERVLIFFAR